MKKIVSIALMLLSFALAHAQWSQTSGPGGGSISGLVSTGRYLIASTGVSSGSGYGGGIYRSTDNGVTWNAANYSITSRDDRDVASLAVSGANVAAGMLNGVVYLSSDTGATWTRLPIGFTTKAVLALASDGINFYAGTDGDGVYGIPVNGSNWTSLSSGLTNKRMTCLFANGSNLYATAAYGSASLFKSTDAGATWSPITAPSGAFNGFSVGAYGSKLFYGAQNGAYVSADGGSTWSARISGLTSTASVIYSNGTTLFVGSYAGLYSMALAGTSLTTVPGGFGVTAFTTTSAGYFAGSSGPNGFGKSGVVFSANAGTTWSDRNDGLASTTVEAMLVDGSTIYAATKTNGLFSSTDNGTTWKLLNANVTGGDALAHTLAVSNGTLFAPASSGMLTSTDAGATWSTLSPGFTPNAIYVYGSRIIAGEFGGVWLSTNNGSTWATSNTGLPGGANINCFGSHGSKLFAGLYSQGFYVSTDSGATWSAANTGLSSSRVRSILTMGSDVFVATDGGGVYKSTDDGTTWSSSTNHLSTNCWGLAASGSSLFACNNDGISISQDAGATWHSTFPWSMITNTIVINGTNIFAGSLSNGVWRAGLNDPMLGVNEAVPSSVPTSFTLEQNYPNPFNPSTTIRFTLARQEQVSLVVYDMLGKVAAFLVDGAQQAGEHAVQWTADNVPSGTYYYRLTTPTESAMGRMVLLK